MVARTLRSTLTVAEVTERWPATAAVFVRHGMACPGCSMAPFDTLAEAAVVYRRDLGALLEELAGIAGARIAAPRELPARRTTASRRQRPTNGGER